MYVRIPSVLGGTFAEGAPRGRIPSGARRAAVPILYYIMLCYIKLYYGIVDYIIVYHIVSACRPPGGPPSDLVPTELRLGLPWSARGSTRATSPPPSERCWPGLSHFCAAPRPLRAWRPPHVPSHQSPNVCICACI